MASAARSTALFAAGSLVGGVIVLAAYLGWFAPDRGTAPPPVAPYVTAPERPVQPVADSAQPPRAAAASGCPAQPMAEAAVEGRDGQFMLEAALAARPQADPSAFLAVAREAAQQGRMRDSEVALIAACHAAEQASGARSAPVADVKSEMGQYYVALAAREDADDHREDLLQRATSLFSDSAAVYASALGKNASKTRMAEQRLASVREPSTLQAARRSSTAVLGAARQAAQDGEADAGRGAMAAGAASAIARSDPELAQMERDLQRLRAQAATVARDPQGMQQRDAQLMSRASACQDAACVRRFYAQRRSQLLAEF